METLFRFNVVRRAERAPDEVTSIDLAAETAFQREAQAIPNGSGRRGALRALAATYIASPEFFDAPSEDERLNVLENAAGALDRLLADREVSRADVDKALRDAFGRTPKQFAATSGLSGVLDRVRDSILAIKLSPDDHWRPLRRHAAVLRAMAVTEAANSDNTYPADRSDLARVLHQPLRLPGATLPTRPPSPPKKPRPSPQDSLKALTKRHGSIDRAIRELKGVRPDGFATVPQAVSEGRLPPESIRAEALFKDEVQLRRHALKVAFATETLRETNADRGLAAENLPKLPYAVTSPALGVGSQEVSASRGATLAISGHPSFAPTDAALVGLRMTPQAQRALSPDTMAMLKEEGLSAADPVGRTVEALVAKRREVFAEAQTLVRPMAFKTFQTFGSTTVLISNPVAPRLLRLDPSLLDVLFGTDAASGVPTTHADIRPAGVMDLLLVKQQLMRYERSDVSHITNVLKGEKRDRVHRTRHETETLTFVETETTVTTEQSLETTDRFEMRRESEEALEEQTSVKGGLTVKGKYGPSVEFEASAEASWQRKATEASKAATEVAREVTQKASEKLSERVLRRESTRVNRQLEITEQRLFDNTGGTEHVAGVYQWITKVYEAQVFNYGPRTVYDIMIPEPAALLLESFQRRRTAAVELEKPPAFDVTPGDLTEDNYEAFVVLYGATDVTPPPAPYVTETYDFNTGGEDKDQEFTDSTRISIPAGYEAIRATVGRAVMVWDDWVVDLVIGQRAHRFHGGNGAVWSTALDEETGSVPYAMATDRVGDIGIAIEVVCASTDRALELWKAETHAKLTQAFDAKMAEYEARLAELQADAPPEITSGPEAKNLALIVEELKRNAIAILTEQHFDRFDAIETDAEGLPQPSFGEAEIEGRYVRFFEQAFEWENLSWVAYPYFWGRKEGWLDKLAMSDGDQAFESFLKAGYVRLQVPIRPGFVDAVDHFRLYGEPWSGGPLPAISDDTYLPIATEIAEKLDRPGDETPQGEPWEVRVPTTLVTLRADDSLPAWEKDAAGTWTEA